MFPQIRNPNFFLAIPKLVQVICILLCILYNIFKDSITFERELLSQRII